MRRAFRSRLRILAGLLALFALFLVVRLYFVQLIHGSDYALKAQHQYESASRELYDRGTIYFSRKDGTLISAASLATGFTVAIDPKHLTDPEKAYAAISAQIPIDKAAFDAMAAKKEDPYEAIEHHVSEEAGAALAALHIPGVMVDRERWRTYPGGAAAAQSIGFVGYDSENKITGRYGLERKFEDTLSRESQGLFGNFFAELFSNLDSVIADAGRAHKGDLVTTIDPMVEDKLDQVLKATNDHYQSAETGAIIMDAATGEIIALDTYPSFDPNDLSHGSLEHFGNPLVEKRYEFGSIMKALTMTTGIDSGAVSPNTTYNDTGCITVNTKKICNYDLKARGVVPMQQVLSQSLNVGASFVATKVGHDRFSEYIQKLGFGDATGIDLPNEIRGDIKNFLASHREVELDTVSFGQGISVTPVEMIRALSALSNHGTTVSPHIVKAVHLENGITKQMPVISGMQVYKPESVDAVSKMLVEVVDKKLANGTLKIPEITVAAKTGTAQVAAPGGGYYDTLYFHSFFGYVPAYNPRYILLLYTRYPQGVQYASETLTAPFFELVHFLINYYSIPPDRAKPAAPAS